MEAENAKWYIYALLDPRTEAIRYIGKTTRPDRRLREHVKESRSRRNCYKSKWIRRLVRDGVEPEMALIESGFGESWREREAFWVEELRESCRLVNTREGGHGPSFRRLDDEARAKMSFRQRERCARRGPMPQETREKLRAANLGKKLSAEHVAKIASGRRGKKLSDETKTRMSAAQKRRHGKEDFVPLPPRIATSGKQVIQVETGKVFESQKAAARAAGVDPDRIRKAVRSGGLCFGFHYVGADTPDSLVQWRTQPRPVVCHTDNVRFASLTEAAKYAGVHPASLGRALRMGHQCKGRRYGYEEQQTPLHPIEKFNDTGRSSFPHSSTAGGPQ